MSRPVTAQTLPAQLAKASWMAPALALIVGYFVRQAGEESGVRGLVVAVTGVLFFLTGLVCGVIALASVRRHGARGVLVPASIGTLISGILVAIVGSALVGSLRAPSPQARLDALAAKIQAELPKMVDQDTQFTAIRSLPGELVYEYTFVHHQLADLDRAKFESAIRPMVRQALCSELAFLWNHGFIARVGYTTADGQRLTDVVLTARDCGR